MSNPILIALEFDCEEVIEELLLDDETVDVVEVLVRPKLVPVSIFEPLRYRPFIELAVKINRGDYLRPYSKCFELTKDLAWQDIVDDFEEWKQQELEDALGTKP